MRSAHCQGGYLERHKHRRPNDAKPPNRLGPQPGLPAGRGHSTRDVLGLGNFTDAIHTNLDLLTLSNVPPGSPTMWVHLASCYVITLVALKVSAQPCLLQVAPHRLALHRRHALLCMALLVELPSCISCSGRDQPPPSQGC